MSSAANGGTTTHHHHTQCFLRRLPEFHALIGSEELTFDLARDGARSPTVSLRCRVHRTLARTPRGVPS